METQKLLVTQVGGTRVEIGMAIASKILVEVVAAKHLWHEKELENVTLNESPRESLNFELTERKKCDKLGNGKRSVFWSEICFLSVASYG